MLDDDKNLDKTLNRLMIGGAALTSALIIAGAYDAGYQSGRKETQAPITVHGDLTINNNSNNQNSSQPTSQK
ncbi:hypothetical protein [Tychonema sp. LEGE 06208]|uniref:hypothetical protein n=1 Tax=Tychonema sp. LEGE 06208 TaxID=1828663 RepID=UPI001880F890|nr:hypothetical protein [Tychonema sp. LEGE 06208]MBE9163991.1 hypothetical protein [Tychonema sp. LEGE 06208]